MLQDPIADMLTRIRNANQRKHEKVSIPSSTIKVGIAQILKDEGYIQDYKIEQNKELKAQKDIIINLKYFKKNRVISGIKRISKPGLRVYSNYDKLPKVLNGFGIAIISTSNGIMTDNKAREAKIGGEVLAWVW